MAAIIYPQFDRQDGLLQGGLLHDGRTESPVASGDDECALYQFDERPYLTVIDGGTLAALRRRRPAAVYRRRRLVAAAMVLAVVLLTLLGAQAVLPAGAGPAAAPAAPAPAGSTPGRPTPEGPAPAGEVPSVFVAEAGDSLWSIARRVQPVGDIRPLVDAMSTANGGTTVHAGQRVLVSNT